MKVNNFLCSNKENEKDDSLIINDDLFEQKDLDSDDDQIILNEERDEECSFFSDNSKNELNKLNIISNNINKPNENNIQNENNKNIKSDNIQIKKEEKDKKDNVLDNQIEKKVDIKNIENKEEIKIEHDNNLLLDDKILKQEINNNGQINNNANYQQEKMNNGVQNSNINSKNYFSKKVIYKKNIFNKNQENNQISKEHFSTNNNFQKKELSKSKEKNNILIKTEQRQKSKNSYINKMKEKKNMKINYNNHSKLWKNSSRNDEGNKSGNTNEKKNLLSKTEISFDKYGNKKVIKKNGLNNKLTKIKIDKKINRSFDRNFNNKNNMNHTTDIKYISNSPKITHKRINFTNNKKSNNSNNTEVNKSSVLISKKNTKNSLKDKDNWENNTDGLKKVLMKKINQQINDIIKKKEKLFFNENNKLFFLGFCDILFELGFLHIKETEINDISKIKNNINNLYTQPFTNRSILSENLLFNEQKLLICAWKTILNNFILIKEFDSLPEEAEEITLDDCKLFIYIITGLFIGFNSKCQNINTNLQSERKVLKNKSLSNFRKNNSSKDFFNKVKLNQSYSKSSKSKSKKKFHFRKKSENNNMLDSNNESNYSNSTSNENILKNILENRKKSEYNYKSILKIKNFFTYFAELRKLYNLYKKDLKYFNKKKEVEKELTFQPKTNQNNRIYLNKFSPKMDFFQRNDLIKKRNEKKIILLQKERSQKLLKECTFEPCKNNKSSKKIEPLNPKEITNRLYHSTQNSQNLKNIVSNTNPCKHGEKIMLEKKYKEIYHFAPNINKNFNREMFNKSPLDKDELLNKRIKDLREANTERIIHNYEKNTRWITGNELKKDKNILLNEILLEDKGGMKLDMEKKTNKDTFDSFQNYYYYYDFSGINNYIYQNEINEPLFSVEIKIKQNIKTIEVYQDDIPEKLAYDFCMENSLGKGSYEKIVNIIKDKLDEIHNGNINENIPDNDHMETNEEVNIEQKNNINNGELNNQIKINNNIIKENIESNNNNDDNFEENEIVNINLNDDNNNKENEEIINEENNMKDLFLNDSINLDNPDKSTEEIKEEMNKINIENKINKNDFEEEKNISNNENE